ncbi:hypothetical protein ABK040_016626 [Willaertia magna]
MFFTNNKNSDEVNNYVIHKPQPQEEERTNLLANLSSIIRYDNNNNNNKGMQSPASPEIVLPSMLNLTSTSSSIHINRTKRKGNYNKTTNDNNNNKPTEENTITTVTTSSDLSSPIILSPTYNNNSNNGGIISTRTATSTSNNNNKRYCDIPSNNNMDLFDYHQQYATPIEANEAETPTLDVSTPTLSTPRTPTSFFYRNQYHPNVPCLLFEEDYIPFAQQHNPAEDEEAGLFSKASNNKTKHYILSTFLFLTGFLFVFPWIILYALYQHSKVKYLKILSKISAVLFVIIGISYFLAFLATLIVVLNYYYHGSSNHSETHTLI